MSNIKKPAPLKEIKPIKRECLKCSKKFLSEGIHNRLCWNCNNSNTNLADLMERIV